MICLFGGPCAPFVPPEWSPLDVYPNARVYLSTAGVTSADSATRQRIGFQSLDIRAGEAHDWVDGQGMVELASGRLLLAGGSPTGHSSDSVNTIWYSDDRGKTWAVLRAGVDRTTWDAGDAAYQAANPVPGHTFPLFTMTITGTEWLYWIGGDTYNPNGNAYRSSDGGTTWTRITTTAPTSALQICNFGVLNNVIYLVGGHTTLLEASTSTASNVVWKSEDYGFTWTSMGAAPFAARGMQLGKMPEKGGKLYLVAGGVTDTPVSPEHLFYNDVWTFDGSTWTQILANGNSQIPKVRYHSVPLYNDRFFLINGSILREMSGAPTLTFDAAGKTITRSAGSWITDGFILSTNINVRGSVSNNLTGQTITGMTATVLTLSGASIVNEGPVGSCTVTLVDSDTTGIYSSSDGVTWARFSGTYPYGDSHAGAAVGTSDGLYFTHGFQNGFCFVLREHTGALVSSWADQGGGGLDLLQPSDASRPILDTTGFASRPGLVFTKDQALTLAAPDRNIASGGFEVYVVLKTLNFDESSTSGPNPPASIVNSVNGSQWNGFGLDGDEVNYRTQAPSTDNNGGSGVNTDTIHVIGAQHTAAASGTVNIYLDEALVGTATGVGFSTSWTGWDSVGAGYLGNDSAECVIAAVVVLVGESPADDTFRSNLQTWAAEWGE